MDPDVAARAAGQGQGAPERLQGAAGRRRRRSRRAEIYIAARAAAWGYRRRGARPAEGLRRQLLMEDVRFTLPRGGIVGVIGPNGAGKTTLFRMIIGQEQPDGGVAQLKNVKASRTRNDS